MERRRLWGGAIRGAAEVGVDAVGLLRRRVLEDPGSGGAIVEESGDGAFRGGGGGAGEV